MIPALRSDVSIRPYAAGDLPLLERLLGDPAMMLHLGGPESRDAIAARHARYLAYDGSTEDLFTIVVGPEQTAAGWVGYWQTSWQGEDVWECGWHVLPEFQGAGVAAAGTSLMLGRARARGVHRFMHAFPAIDNAASNAVCRRLGFETLGEVEVEYPKGTMMRSTGWRLDLDAPAGPAEVRIASAAPEDAEALTAIAHEAKAHWGYGPDLLALWADDLAVTARFIQANRTFVAYVGREIAGFAAVIAGNHGCELEHLWVRPRWMGNGIGRQLFSRVVDELRPLGPQNLHIASDPHAEGFYVAMGAKRIGEVDSTPAGRRIPLMSLAVGEPA